MVRRTPETLVDWLVVGIAPFLIMLLVGSLVFYLVEVFYLGDYQLRLLWVLGLFVMAIVCIARISMEEGATYASMYAVPLAGAVGLALSVFVEVKGPLAALGPALNWMLMGIVWWSAHKLTWDCTLIEGGRDFTGQGLMQTTGLDRFFRVNSANAAPPAEPQPDLSATTTIMPSTLPLWKWWESDKRPHAPGVWVVYFSIAALPLFGLGQWFMPAGNLDLRRRTFWLLVVYVAAGLLLLMSTSFLSLRRYLRQRNLEMPGEMAAVWLGTGSAMVFILLIIASLLPRPIPEYSITHLAPEIKSPDLNPSRWGWGKEGTKSKPGVPNTATKGKPADRKKTGPGGQPSSSAQGPDQAKSGSTGNNGQSSSGNSPSESQSNDSSQQRQSKQQNDAGKSAPSQNSDNSSQQQANSSQQPANSQQNKSPGENSSQPNSQSQQQNSNDNNPQNNQSPPPDNSPTESQQTPPLPNETPTPPPTNYLAEAMNQVFAYLAHALKWLFYLLVIGVLAYFAWQHRERLLAAWQQLLNELRDLWNKWFGLQPAIPAAAAPVAVAPPPKRFAEYADPFSSGLAARWSLAELVRYTFEALEARGREQNCPRGSDQTPLEYATAVGQVEPALASEFRLLADLYGQLAFARGAASPQSTSLLQQLWQRWK